MKPTKFTAPCLALLIGASAPAFADTTEYGRVYKLFPEQHMVKIDGNELKIYGGLHIFNLAGGSTSQDALTPGTYVRYTLGDDGQLKAIWIYPSDPEKRFELGYNPAKLQQ